ncbi:MAG: hypothetical protein ABW076_07735 [Candidatus Thiodiazotropha sp.]
MKLTRSYIALLLLLLLFGCGGGDSGSTDDTGTDTTDPGTDTSDPGTTTGTLPADPGDAGKITLGGIDSDNDGVRDDVQIAIYDRYPNDETKRNALTQNAIALQEAIFAGDTSDSETITVASGLVINAVDCLHETVDDPTADLGFLELNVVNTSDRSDAYIKFNEALSGQFFGGDDTVNPCQ